MKVSWIEREDGSTCVSGYPIRMTRRVRDGAYLLHTEGFATPQAFLVRWLAFEEAARMAAQMDRTRDWATPALTGSLVLDGAK